MFDIKSKGKLNKHTCLTIMPANRKTPAIGCLSSHVGFHLRLAQLAVFEAFASRLGEIDVTPAIFSVLEVLHQNDGITQSKLAAAVRLERSSVVPLLDKLAKRGLVERRASTTDRRHNHLHLTDAGRDLLAEAIHRASLHEKEVCKPFTIAEKKLLLELLSRFRLPKA
ncbi:MAG: MarR family transcriptional regulator [Rhodocyclales bacterium]|nr:MarR family transcriptional regulator [Rhodocyclales bacterium]